MAGLDEAQARVALATMQERLERGPQAVLGVSAQAPANEIRSAFLALTKLYHPARFGRMSTELQRLANEVFLGIMGAHDALRLPVPRSPTSPGMPVIRVATPPGASPGTPAVPRPTTLGMPPLRSPNGFERHQITDKVSVPPAGVQAGAPTVRIVGERSAGVPVTNVPKADRTSPLSLSRIGEPPAPAPQRPVNSTPMEQQRLRRLPDPSVKTPPLELSRPTLPRMVRTPEARTTGSVPPIEAFPRIETTPGVSAKVPGVGRLDPSTTMPPAASVAVAVDLLAAKQWDAARVALSALAAMAPESKHVRALISFAAGRQAQVEHRLDEARVDLQRALQLDPDLAVAKAALAELFARRK